MLLVDDREHIPLREKIQRAIPTAEAARLPAADYLLFDQDGHSIGIERKEISDLLGSLANNKVGRQVQSLLQFDRGILLIEGQWKAEIDGKMRVHGRLVGWRAQSVQAILLALQEQTGVKVLHTANHEETVVVLKMLEKRGEAGCFWPKEEGEQDEQRAA
jgi:ERCC4-type nuclease